jgi:hypothetical protein
LIERPRGFVAGPFSHARIMSEACAGTSGGFALVNKMETKSVRSVVTRWATQEDDLVGADVGVNPLLVGLRNAFPLAILLWMAILLPWMQRV